MAIIYQPQNEGKMKEFVKTVKPSHLKGGVLSFYIVGPLLIKNVFDVQEKKKKKNMI